MRHIKLKELFEVNSSNSRVTPLKHRIYLILFVCLGVMVSYFIFVVSVAASIFLLLIDFKYYGLGLSWEAWTIIARVWFVLAIVIGALLGHSSGKYWWKYIYVDKKLKKHRCL